MRKLYLIIIVFFVISGCSPMNKSIINNAQRTDVQELELSPEYDIYNIRIDIIRQTTTTEVNGNTTTTYIPYHPLGFDLGNSLFMDLNNNLSFLVPQLLDVEDGEDFRIKIEHMGSFFNNYTLFEKSDNQFISRNNGLINLTSTTSMFHSDSSLLINQGIFGNYEILRTDSSLIYKSLLNKSRINKNEEGYVYKKLLWKRQFTQENRIVHLGKNYVLRMHDDKVEIFSNGLFNKQYLLYSIIKIDNSIYVYDRNYIGMEIIKKDNKIDVKRNKRLKFRYTIE